MPRNNSLRKDVQAFPFCHQTHQALRLVRIEAITHQMPAMGVTIGVQQAFNVPHRNAFHNPSFDQFVRQF